MSSDVVAYRMSTHIEALARALADAGAPAEGSMKLLELAAVAAMHAVSLSELGAEETPEPAREPEPEPAPHPLPRAA